MALGQRRIGLLRGPNGASRNKTAKAGYDDRLRDASHALTLMLVNYATVVPKVCWLLVTCRLGRPRVGRDAARGDRAQHLLDLGVAPAGELEGTVPRRHGSVRMTGLE